MAISKTVDEWVASTWPNYGKSIPGGPPTTGVVCGFVDAPPAPAIIPADDQISVLAHLHRRRPEGFEDFAATLNRRQAWSTPVGQFLAWLLCGSTAPPEPGHPCEITSAPPAPVAITDSAGCGINHG